MSECLAPTEEAHRLSCIVTIISGLVDGWHGFTLLKDLIPEGYHPKQQRNPWNCMHWLWHLAPRCGFFSDEEMKKEFQWRLIHAMMDRSLTQQLLKASNRVTSDHMDICCKMWPLNQTWIFFVGRHADWHSSGQCRQSQVDRLRRSQALVGTRVWGVGIVEKIRIVCQKPVQPR